MATLKSKSLWIQKYFKRIKKLYPKVKKVYGPYLNTKDGRHTVILYDGIKRTGKQYAKLKMEVKFKRVLGRDDTVDHLDGDITNDKYYNLEIVPRIDHIKRDVIRLSYKETALCLGCYKEFVLTVSQVRSRNTGKAGPFCSRQCTGRYGTSIQNGSKKLKRTALKTKKMNNKGHTKG